MAVGFSIGNKGYIGTGYSGSGISDVDDFWEYDPVTNEWTQKADYAGGPEQMAVGFSIGNKGYIGLGRKKMDSDFWEYDPISNQWTRKADFLGSRFGPGVGFSIGNKGYIEVGSLDSSIVLNFAKILQNMILLRILGQERQIFWAKADTKRLVFQLAIKDILELVVGI